MPSEKQPPSRTPSGATTQSKAGKLPKQGEVSDKDLDQVSGGKGSQSTGAGKVPFNP